MANVTKTIRYDLLVNDRLTGGMTAGARATDKAALAMDAASRSARVLDRALASQRKAADVSAGASLALARADKILEDAEQGLAEGALEAEFALKKQEMAAKSAARQNAAAGAAAGAAGSGFGGMGGAMGAAVAAGVALSPVIVTLAAGLGGLGLAAAGVAKNQQLMRRELAPLKADYAAFQKSLQPVVLQDLGAAVTIAQHGLHDLEPVTRATGKALAGFLSQIDAELQSKNWQQFFTWMGQEAGPDVRLVGNAFTSWLNVLPGVLESLQPIAEQMLILTANLARATNAVTDFGKSNNAVSRSVGTNTGLLGFLAKAVSNVTSFMHPGGVVAGAYKTALDGIPPSAGKAGDATRHLGDHAYTAAGQMRSLWQQVTSLTAAENKALSPLLNYSNALITQTNDAANLNKALKASHDRIGLKTGAERASFSAANTYIQDLLNTAAAAGKSHRGLDDVIASLRNEIPRLQNAKGGTAAYRQEVSTLVGWLHRLQQIKRISEAIHVSGTGVWTVTPGKIGLPGGSAGGPFAAGGRIRAGSTETADDVLIRASRNETIVSAAHSRILAPAFRAVGVPGYASGGVVGSWPRLPGLGPWAGRELRATQAAIGRSVASALIAGIKSASANPFAGITGVPSGGAIGAGAASAQAFARSILWAYGWGMNQFPPLQALWNGESGWRWNALNPSSGAYGIPQALPASKMASAGADWRTNAATQIRWGLGYIKSVYGSPANTYARWLARSPHWYGDGLDAVFGAPTLIGVGERGRERVQVTPLTRGGDGASTVNVTYNVNVNVPPTASKADTGRVIVEHIRAYEQGSGSRWRR